MVKIESVNEGSLSARAGVRSGDTLVAINGNAIRDVLDYRFYLADVSVRLELERNGSRFDVTLEKGEYEDIGLEFETPLMDKKHTCRNGCVFCFIDQMPKGMRETLYFKDDDDRLSFLHGNYVTLTNLSDEDIDRIIRMHISPVNVSVHTTNPDLRVRMMKNKRAGEVLSYLPRLADAGISLCTQIVLCKGLNDGQELERSMHDLVRLYPALSSCAIVPVGLTKFRDGLYPLELFTPEECAAVIRQVTAFSNWCLKEYGTRLFYCSDEFYVRAGLPLPSDESYEDYSQIENGVGMLTSLETEFTYAMEDLEGEIDAMDSPRVVSMVTGDAAFGLISRLAERLMQRNSKIEIRVHRIVNRFFGESVTVAGLLTGKDVSEQLSGVSLGDELLIPAVMLRADGDVFLDDMSPDELSRRLGVPVRAVPSDGYALLRAMIGCRIS